MASLAEFKNTLKKTLRPIALPIYRSYRKGYQDLCGYLDRFMVDRTTISKSIIVTGFWRSGTTWLMEELARFIEAKTFYEPFNPSIEAYRAHLNQRSLPSSERKYLVKFMPWQSTPNRDGNGGLRTYVEAVLRGAVRSRALRVSRRSPWESFKTRSVLKSVRAQFLTGFFCDHLDLPVLHISRDPRAVLASILRKNWGSWLYDIDLVDQLLKPTDGRRTFFSTWTDDIKSYNELDKTRRITAYWCLTEHYSHRELDRTSLARRVTYREFYDRPDAVLQQAAALSDTNESELPDRSPSATTTSSRLDATREERLFGWKKELKRETRDKIEETVEDFGMTDRLE